MGKEEKKTSDGVWSMGDWDIGDINTGSASEMLTVDGMSYSFGDLGDMGQLDLFDEMELRDKYPALKQAWEHYQSILEICKTKEKEESE